MIRRPPRSTLFSLHDALPISPVSAGLLRHVSARRSRARGPHRPQVGAAAARRGTRVQPRRLRSRSEEHTSELQSQSNLVCRLLLEKKKKQAMYNDMVTDVIDT